MKLYSDEILTSLVGDEDEREILLLQLKEGLINRIFESFRKSWDKC